MKGRISPSMGQWPSLAALCFAHLLICVAVTEAADMHPVSSAKYDLVIRNVTVADVTGKRFVPAQDIAVLGGRIQRIAATGDGVAAGRIIDGSRLIAMPGFVDTHTHLWQHVARGVASSGQLQNWARKVYRFAHHALPTEVRDIVSAAAGEALLGGITTIADFTSNNFSDRAGEATLQAMRENNIDGALVWWRPAVFLPWQLQDRQIAGLRRMAGAGISIWAGIGPMSFFSLPSVYDGVEAARRNGMPVTEHSMENLAEARDLRKSLEKYLEGFGAMLAEGDRASIRSIVERPAIGESDAMVDLSRMATVLRTDALYSSKLSPAERQSLGAIGDYDPASPVALLDSWDILQGFVAIHGVWPSADDIQIFGKRHAAVSYNPESNMYLASGIAPITAYRTAGVRVTLGTDGAASNDRISMFDAMRAASMNQKVKALSPDVTAPLDDWFWLRAATIEGAAALNMADRTGSLEAGKEADILLLDRTRLGLAPFVEGDEGAAALVNRATARDVRFVIANGRLMVDDGRLAGKSEATRAARLDQISRILRHRAEKGSSWRDRITLNPNDASRGWWLYRSIRAADEIDIVIVNAGPTPLKLVLGFSGTAFGGTIPPTFHPASSKRYPLSTNPEFFARSIVLPKRASLQVSRASNGKSYAIRFDGKVEERLSVAAEQIAVFAADDVDFQRER